MNIAKQRLPTQPGQPIFTSAAVSIQKSPSFSSNAIKNYSSRGAHVYVSESYDTDSTTSECVRSIPSFQMGKRFFSTKPHQMAQFDRDFSSVARCSSANTSNHKTTPDPNLMTHSATESLLSRHNVISTGLMSAQEVNNHRLETVASSPNANTSISSNINARILSISPLDSLVISAINQLSSKLRTRMRGFLEKERLNHSIGSETRSLIDEILPQVSTATGLDSQSGQSKNPYNHDPSNISRDLTNILKNMKKVEQIFDGMLLLFPICFLNFFFFSVFSMLVEPANSQEVSTSANTNNSNVIITHASDSDSGDGQSHPKYSMPTIRQQAKHQFMNRFIDRSPPSQSPPSSSTRSGFFIEI